MNKVIAGIVALGVTATLSGCMNSAMGGTLVREGVPTGQIWVQNASNVDITVVTVSECNAMSHGLNRMADGVVLEPGNYYPFTVSQGCYDVQAGYGWGTGYAVADFNNIQVPAGQVFKLTVN